MRIAHVTATFPPYYGGTGNVCFHNARGLADLGHNVRVITARQPLGQMDSPAGVEVQRLPAVLRLGNAPLLPHLLSVSNVDIIHLHLPFIFGAELTWINALRQRIPYVVTYHMDLSGIGFRKAIFNAYQAALVPPVLRNAAMIMPTTLDYARACKLAPVLARCSDKMIPMPNGVDTEFFRPMADGGVTRQRYRLEEDDSVVLFVAALDRAHSFKGLEVLFKALTLSPSKRVKAVIVGDGDLKTSYMRLAQRLGLTQRTVFCGRVPQEQLPAYYALADCLVLPSVTMGEAFGMVLLEAMACGKPVIASNLPGVRSVVSDGEDGLLVRPGDAADLADKIQELLKDPQRLRKMGECGRMKAETEYTWTKIVPRLAAVYDRVLGNEVSSA